MYNDGCGDIFRIEIICSAEGGSIFGGNREVGGHVLKGSGVI